MAHGQKVICIASERLKPTDPPGGSLYQNWKFQTDPGVMAPLPQQAGGAVKSMQRQARPFTLIMLGGPRRNI